MAYPKIREDFDVSIYCPYCRRHTALTTASRKLNLHSVPCMWEKGPNDVWWIGICNSCKEPLLVHNKGDKIYPNSLPSPTDERVPENIRKDIDEAKICFSIKAYRACAVMARRALQTVCNEKLQTVCNKREATKEKLVEQLKKLVEKGIITENLKTWADVVRWVGNDAAHPGANEVKKEDAEDILKLVEEFIKVVYVTPAIAEERKSKRKK